MSESILKDLEARGLLHDVSNHAELDALFKSAPVPFYCGFDPTADSLHVGSMLPLITMRRFQLAGHPPIALVGAATGMIGDPSFKSEERKLLSEEAIAQNISGIEKQISLFLDASGKTAFTLVRNDTWLRPISALDFLRDVGKHFSVNAMIAKESVRARLENREQGISFTEFSYILLQAYDFYHLAVHNSCRLQIGGSDQWGNITAGIDLARRKGVKEQLFGLTFPLLKTSSGTKFGKTERGTVWLDPERTSPYLFYQFWFNTPDADAIPYLRSFTECSLEEISALENDLKQAPERREAQRKLAYALTSLVHGMTEADRAIQASNVLFGQELAGIDSKTIEEIFSEVPSVSMNPDEAAAGLAVLDLLVKCGAAQSKGAAKRLIEGGGVYINNVRLSDLGRTVTRDDFIDGRALVVRTGKKSYFLIRID